VLNIGLPDISVPSHLKRVVQGTKFAPAMLDERGLPTRVLPEERRENLAELAAIARDNDIRLVIIHPAYRDSVRHECLLTEFCSENQVTIFEAYDVLHAGPRGMYIDTWHPSPAGHERLPRALSRMIVGEVQAGK
jgi:hypothetical protein